MPFTPHQLLEFKLLSCTQEAVSGTFSMASLRLSSQDLLMSDSKLDPEYRKEMERLQEEQRIDEIKRQARLDFKSQQKADQRRRKNESRASRDISPFLVELFLISVGTALFTSMPFWFVTDWPAQAYWVICSGPSWMMFKRVIGSVARCINSGPRPDELHAIHKHKADLRTIPGSEDPVNSLEDVNRAIRNRKRNAYSDLVASILVNGLLILAYTALIVALFPIKQPSIYR